MSAKNRKAGAGRYEGRGMNPALDKDGGLGTAHGHFGTIHEQVRAAAGVVASLAEGLGIIVER